jgi:uroporphyrinogen decarboxylase
VTIIGNIDARHILCRGTPDDVRRDVRSCLEWGRKTPGGHILHTSHSIHEDVPVANYLALVDEYRRYFGLSSLG